MKLMTLLFRLEHFSHVKIKKLNNWFLLYEALKVGHEKKSLRR